MNEVKTPKRPLIYYALLALFLILLLNFMFVPMARKSSIEDVDYGTFMQMTEDHEIKEVEVEESKIYFVGTDGKTYETNRMDDPNLTERLYDSGAKFTSEIGETISPFLSFLLYWVLPIAILWIIGAVLSHRLQSKASGGPNSMMFGMGNSNAKVYVPSSEGIRFDDVAGEDEAKENLTEIVE